MAPIPLPILPSRTSWNEFARWFAILTDPVAVAAAHSTYPATNPALGDGLAISPAAAAALFSAPLDGSPSPDFYPATIIDQRALTTLTLDTSVASGIATSAGGVTLPYTWRGYVLQGGTDADPEPPPPTGCLEPEYKCYSRLGRGDTYTPAIDQASPSLHDIDTGGFRTDSWLETGVGGGVATATIDPFGGVPLELGDSSTQNGVAFGIQFALKITGTLPGAFTLLWQLNGNQQAQLWGRRVGGLDEYEWRTTPVGATVVASPKVALAQNGWIVFGVLYEAFHLVCKVASADCDATPFGTLSANVARITDLDSLVSDTVEFSANGNSIDDMTFFAAATTVGWACALVGFVRTGIVLDGITVPANCLSFLGQTCLVPLTGTCMAFDPTRCIECYPTDRVIPLRVSCAGVSPEMTLTITAGGVHVLYDPIIGTPATLGPGGVAVDPTFRIDPSNCFPVQIVDTGAEVVVEDNPLALPVRAAAGGPTINPPPTPPPDPTPGPDPAPTPDADPTCAVPDPTASTNTDCNDPI